MFTINFERKHNFLWFGNFQSDPYIRKIFFLVSYPSFVYLLVYIFIYLFICFFVFNTLPALNSAIYQINVFVEEMVSGSVIEIGFIVLLCVSMRSNYVETLPSSFLQDEQQQAEQQQAEQQQAEQQSEAISENFFDEVRQLLEQKISSEAAVLAELETTTTTTESAPIVNVEEHVVDVTFPPTTDRKFKDNLPKIKPPKPTQVSENNKWIW